MSKTKKTNVDWSTPYDDWLIPILNRFRYGGAIECRAIPSEIQIHIDKLIAQATKKAEVRGKVYQTEYIIGRLEKPFVDGSERIKEIKSMLEAALQESEGEKSDHEILNKIDRDAAKAQHLKLNPEESEGEG